MLKRTLALFLTALVALSTLACASDSPSPTETTAAPTATTAPTAESTDPPETELTPDLPDVGDQYKGTELVFLQRSSVSGNYKELWLSAEGYNGDIINDAIFERNNYVQEKYGVKLVFVEFSSPGDALNKVSMTNDDVYDVMYESINTTSGLALSGFLYNIADFGYANYNNPWWDQNAVEGMTYNGKLFGVVSDVSLSPTAGLAGMVFNRDLIRLYQLDDPYQLVKDNKWTLDKVISMITQVSVDLDGDQAMTDADRYGMLVEDGRNINHFIVASGVTIIEDKGTEITAPFMTNEKTYDVIAKWAPIFSDSSITRNYNDLTPDSSGKWTFGRKHFAAGHFLFVQTSARQFEVFNEVGMEEEYGIAPNPKYDEKQERYYHAVDKNYACLSIPGTNDEGDLERLSILMEDLAYKSSKTLVPAYYENVIALRRARVPELGEMVAIMKTSIYYDIATFYSFSYSDPISEAIKTGNTASAFKRYERVIANNIKNLQKKLGNLG